MKLWERVLSERMRQSVIVSDQQLGLKSGKGMTVPALALRLLIEKHKEGQKESHLVSIDFEKTPDRGPQDKLW